MSISIVEKKEKKNLNLPGVSSPTSHGALANTTILFLLFIVVAIVDPVCGGGGTVVVDGRD
jgi:hypothetical protein